MRKVEGYMAEILKALICDGGAVVTVIKSTDIVNKAIKLFDLSPVAAAALGRTLSICSMLGKDLKNDGDKMTAVLNGGGEIGTVTVTASSNGNVKGFVENPHATTYSKNGKLDVGRAVGTDGRLTVVKNLGFDEPYVGSSDLVSGEIAEDFAAYLSQSEQMNCALSLGVLIGKNGRCISAGGVFAKILPGAADSAVTQTEEAFAKMGNVSGLFEGRSAEGVVMTAFDNCNPQIIERGTSTYKCDCSKKRIDKVLATLSKDDIDEIILDRGFIEVVCEFCNKKYTYDKESAYKAVGIKLG
jgi:molecular chaperone Hsp33